ncbi:MAG: hypothetical protein P8L32_00280 [Paracoccaceae bacterium]|jgi:hypothetical protein|nr:hypothetical protein [Paracoccaceae bacterium]
MRWFTAILAVFVSASMVGAEPQYIEAVTLDDGRVLTTGAGEYATVLTLDDEVLLEEAQIGLIDFGRAGILIELAHGGNACPWRYQLIDRDAGSFRVISAGTDQPEVFAECEMLLGVVPEANLVLTYRYDPKNHAIGYAWNGYGLSEVPITISRQGIPAPVGKDMVTRWDRVDPYEMLSDPVEQVRLLSIMSEDEFDRLSWLMSFRSPAIIRGDYLVAEGCVKYMCSTQNAVIAIRVSDGLPFVRMNDDGVVTQRIPVGELVPRALAQN